MGIQELQDLGWGVPAPMAVPTPQPAPAAAPVPQAAPYVPIGAAPTNAFPNNGYGPSTNPGDSQAAAEAALQASLSDGGPVAGKGAAAAGAAALLPPVQTGPATKAGMRPSAESVEVKEGVPVTQDLKDTQDAVRAAGADVAMQQRAVGALQPLEQNVRNQEEAINEKRLADAEANRQKDYGNELAQERWKRDKAHAAFELAAGKGIDPDHYWKNKGVGGTIATALALMAGGFVSGMNGGPNQALEQVNKAIDRDISAPRENLETTKGQQDEADTHMGLFVKEGMDKTQAAAAATVLARQQFAKALDAKYTATSNAMGKLTLAKAIQDNAAKMAEAEQGYQKLTADSVTKKVDEKYQAATGGGSGAPTRKAVSELAAKLISDGKYSSPDDAMRAAGHILGFDPAGAPPVADATAKGAGKVSPRIQTRLADIDAQAKAADELDKLLTAGSSLSPSDRARATALAEMLRRGGHQSVPEHPLETFSSTSARRAGLEVVKSELAAQRSALEARSAGGSAPEPEDAAANEDK